MLLNQVSHQREELSFCIIIIIRKFAHEFKSWTDSCRQQKDLFRLLEGAMTLIHIKKVDG